MKTTPERRRRERGQAILMAERGRPHSRIAEDLGVSVRTLQRGLNTSHAKGRAGLTIRWARGRAPRIPETLATEILAWITEGPVGCGLGRAHWPSAELAARLYRTPGLVVRASTMQTFCATQGVRPSRPTYRSRKGHSARQETARQDLQDCKKKPPPTSVSC
jgi:transposase